MYKVIQSGIAVGLCYKYVGTNIPIDSKGKINNRSICNSHSNSTWKHNFRLLPHHSRHGADYDAERYLSVYPSV